MSKIELGNLFDKVRQDPAANPEIVAFLNFFSDHLNGLLDTGGVAGMFAALDVQGIEALLGERFDIRESELAIKSAGRLIMDGETDFNKVIQHLSGYEQIG